MQASSRSPLWFLQLIPVGDVVDAPESSSDVPQPTNNSSGEDEFILDIFISDSIDTLHKILNNKIGGFVFYAAHF